MKKLFFMAVAAIAALSSCTSDNELELNQNTGKEALTFTATMEDSEATRATYDNTNQYALWEAGDQISINGKSYTAQEGAGATATFKATTTGEEAEGPTYNAYFACTYDGATATLPAEISETWANGKFNMPMYANSETTSLKFYNLCGVLKITVTNAQLASVKCITVSSTNKAVSGKFTVSDKAAVLTDASNTANTVTVTYTDAVTTDATGNVFYVAVPAQTYKNLSIAVSDGTTTMVMTTKADQDITVARNTVYPINFNGQPTTATAKRTGDIEVNWVQLWAGGPKFAEYNVGATSATEYGGYYCWGSSTDKDKRSSYNKDANVLTGTDDTATNLWGSNWRMPTQAELEALINSENCTVELIDGDTKKYNNTIVTGLLCTGKNAYSCNSIFLPAAGQCYKGNVRLQVSDGYYWSSTPYGSDNAYYLYFYLDGLLNDYNVDYYDRYYGYSVRAVLAE